MEGFFGEKYHVSTEAGDLNTPFVGKRLDMKKVERLTAIINVTGGIAATVTLALRQHKLASGGDSKALPYKGKYFYKLAADAAYTQVEVEGDGVASIDLSAIFASASGTIILETMQEFLDVDNNFRFVSLEPVDATVASAVAITYVGDAKFKPGYASAM
jgi:hypothetical protein